MNPVVEKSGVDVLLVEDDPCDQHVILAALEGGEIDCRPHLCEDITSALAFLRKTGSYTEAPNIDLIFLDLNLPGASGLRMLEELKADERLAIIPVIVVTSSEAPKDIYE